MAIQFPCSQCGRTLKVDNRFAGAKIRCPKCGAITRATATDHLEPEPAVAPTAPSPAEQQAAQAAASAALSRSGILSDDDEIEPVSFGKDDREEDELDMTPMVDVTFLLLIFFMITAAFSLQKSLEIPKPSEDCASTQDIKLEVEEGNIIVRVDHESIVWVNDSEAPSEQDLLVKLREAKAGVPGTDSAPINAVLVQADKEAIHEKVVMVLDACNAVNFEPIKLQTVSEDDF